MPIQSRQRVIHEKQLDKHLMLLPDYVAEYIISKKRIKYSPSTLLGYLHEYIRFFTWIQKEDISKCEAIRETPLFILEHLEKETVEIYIEHLTEEDIRTDKEITRNVPKRTRSDDAVSRNVNALKSLFNYLTRETEVIEGDRKGECYFYRNVFDKIRLKRDKETANYRAKKISAVTYTEEETDDFLHYMRNIHETKCTNRQRAAYLKNKERDIAMISLMLGSGIRVSEVSDLLLNEIDFKRGEINVIRKGNKQDTINVIDSAMDDLKEYLEIRESRYKTTTDDPYVFVTKYGGKVNPISVRSIQKLVIEYTKTYDSQDSVAPGKGMSPHKLRHSFANQWITTGGNLPMLRDQLGHNSIETTSKYTNISANEGKKVLKEIEHKRKKKQE